MRFLKEQDKNKSIVKEIDKSVKNKWSFKWTTKTLSLKLSNNLVYMYYFIAFTFNVSHTFNQNYINLNL